MTPRGDFHTPPAPPSQDAVALDPRTGPSADILRLRILGGQALPSSFKITLALESGAMKGALKEAAAGEGSLEGREAKTAFLEARRLSSNGPEIVVRLERPLSEPFPERILISSQNPAQIELNNPDPIPGLELFGDRLRGWLMEASEAAAGSSSPFDASIWPPLPSQALLSDAFPGGVSFIWTIPQALDQAALEILKLIPASEKTLVVSHLDSALERLAGSLEKPLALMEGPSGKPSLDAAMLASAIERQERETKAKADAAQALYETHKEAETKASSQIDQLARVRSLERSQRLLREEALSKRLDWDGAEAGLSDARSAWAIAGKPPKGLGALIGKAARQEKLKKAKAALERAEARMRDSRIEMESLLGEIRTVESQLDDARALVESHPPKEELALRLSALQAEGKKLLAEAAFLASSLSPASLTKKIINDAAVILARSWWAEEGLLEPGSIFENVILIAPPVHDHKSRQILAREARRAKKRLVVVGDLSAIAWSRPAPENEGIPAWRSFLAAGFAGKNDAAAKGAGAGWPSAKLEQAKPDRAKSSEPAKSLDLAKPSGQGGLSGPGTSQFASLFATGRFGAARFGSSPSGSFDGGSLDPSQTRLAVYPQSRVGFAGQGLASFRSPFGKEGSGRELLKILGPLPELRDPKGGLYLAPDLRKHAWLSNLSLGSALARLDLSVVPAVGPGLRAIEEAGPASPGSALASVRLALEALKAAKEAGDLEARVYMLTPTPTQTALALAMAEDLGSPPGLFVGPPHAAASFPKAALVIMDAALVPPQTDHPWSSPEVGRPAFLKALSLASGALVVSGSKEAVFQLPKSSLLRRAWEALEGSAWPSLTPPQKRPFAECLDKAKESALCALPPFDESWWPQFAPRISSAARRRLKLTVLASVPEESGLKYSDQAIRDLRLHGANVILSQGFEDMLSIIDEKFISLGRLETRAGLGRTPQLTTLELPRAAKIALDLLQSETIFAKLGPGGLRACPACGWPYILVNDGRPRDFGDRQPLKLGCLNSSCGRHKRPRRLDERWPFQSPPLCPEDGITRYEIQGEGKRARWVCPKHPDICPSYRPLPGDCPFPLGGGPSAPEEAEF